MSTTHQTEILEMAPQEARLLRHATPVRVQCLEGSLWLTCYGDSRDLVLPAGGEAELPAGASVVMSARGAARCRVTPLPAAHGQGIGLRRWLAAALASRALQGLGGRVREHVVSAPREWV